jgi:hypothetical protein
MLQGSFNLAPGSAYSTGQAGAAEVSMLFRTILCRIILGKKEFVTHTQKKEVWYAYAKEGSLLIHI